MNKNTVTYTFSTGEKIQISADMLVQHENMTPEQAAELCSMLAELNHAEKNCERRETRRHVSLDVFSDSMNAAKPRISALSVEDELIQAEQCKSVFDAIDTLLPEKQKRRLLARVIDELTYQEIACREGVDHRAVMRSVNAASAKVKKYLSNFSA